MESNCQLRDNPLKYTPMPGYDYIFSLVNKKECGGLMGEVQVQKKGFYHCIIIVIAATAAAAAAATDATAATTIEKHVIAVIVIVIMVVHCLY